MHLSIRRYETRKVFNVTNEIALDFTFIFENWIKVIILQWTLASIQYLFHLSGTTRLWYICVYAYFKILFKEYDKEQISLNKHFVQTDLTFFNFFPIINWLCLGKFFQTFNVQNILTCFALKNLRYFQLQ